MIARRPDTTERRGTGSAGQLLVPVDDTGAAFQPELLVTRFGVRQQASGQPVLGVVGLSDGTGKIRVADHLQQRAKQLFVFTFRHSGHVDDARGQQRGLSLRLGHLQQRHGAIGQHQFLGLHQRFGRSKGDHRAHERRRLLVESTYFNARTHRHQARQQGIAPGTLRHQQAARAGATLARRDKRRLDDGVHRRIHVGDFVHDQRVITAHFQGQDLVGPP